MKGGHNLKPTRLKVLTGTARADRIPKHEPKPRPVAPDCPLWLKKDAREKWDELAPKLERIGLLTEADGEALAALCVHWSLFVKAAKKAQRMALLGKRGNKNPILQVLRDQSQRFESYAAKFGMTPQDRARIDLPQADESDDEFDAPR